MLSRAVASVFFEEPRPQKLPIHGLYAGVARDSCLPCKRFCRAASRAAACRAPVALLVAPRVNVPWDRELRQATACECNTLNATLLSDSWQATACECNTLNSSPPGPNGRHFADDIFRCIFVNEKFCILIKISLKLLPKGPIDNNPALV